MKICLGLLAALTVWATCNSASGLEKVIENCRPEKYAVLINGSSEQRHRINLSVASQLLLEKGFNVQILDYDKENVMTHKVDSVASKENINAAFGNLSKKLDGNDTLFVYVTGHGSRTKKYKFFGWRLKRIRVPKLDIPGRDISAAELKGCYDKIDVKNGILFYDQCYGGDFAEETGGGRYIAIAASAVGYFSNFSEFPRAFFNAFRNKKGDKNGDGKVSIGEAFDYADKTDDFCEGSFVKSDMDQYCVFLD